VYAENKKVIAKRILNINIKYFIFEFFSKNKFLLAKEKRVTTNKYIWKSKLLKIDEVYKELLHYCTYW